MLICMSAHIGGARVCPFFGCEYGSIFVPCCAEVDMKLLVVPRADIIAFFDGLKRRPL